MPNDSDIIITATDAAATPLGMRWRSKDRPYGACPTYFRALCRTASTGGRAGYFTAGYELTRHLQNLAPTDIEDHDWRRVQLDQIDTLLRTSAEDDKIVAWFEQHLPRCMALVPERRRDRFVEGVRACHEENAL